MENCEHKIRGPMAEKQAVTAFKNIMWHDSCVILWAHPEISGSIPTLGLGFLFSSQTAPMWLFYLFANFNDSRSKLSHFERSFRIQICVEGFGKSSAKFLSGAFLGHLNMCETELGEKHIGDLHTGKKHTEFCPFGYLHMRILAH